MRGAGWTGWLAAGRARAAGRDGPAPLPRYLLLFGTLFLGWGVLSPFLPAVLTHQGATASEVGVLLGLGVALRLLAMPLAGIAADRTGAPRQLLAASLVGAAICVLAYGVVSGGKLLLLVAVAQALATAGFGPLPDALAVRAAALSGTGAARLDYGVVRGTGAAAFIVASAGAGLAVQAAGTPFVVLWLNAGCFALAALAALLVPRPAAFRMAGPPAQAAPAGRDAIAVLLGMPGFRRLVLVSGLVEGSHAFYNGFAVLGWQQAGIPAGSIGLLWSVSVLAEVLVFFLAGRWLLARLGAGLLCALAAGAGVVRWSAVAADNSMTVLLLVQPLHGLTFAAQHLAAMALLARLAPDHLHATAQALLASLGTGLFTAVLLLPSGALYERVGPGGFWVMAALCGAALPLANMLRQHSAGVPAPQRPKS